MPRRCFGRNYGVTIPPERADHPQVAALLDALDAYLGTLYPPEANHILDVQALLAPQVHFLTAWRGERAVFDAEGQRSPGQGARVA